MRFESVTAHAFGPFRDRTLEFLRGMNVVFGPNESGKSSWHAALQAGLCGARHRKGAPTKQERDFDDRRRPWQDGNRWAVEVVVKLADGRRIALRQDLAGKNGEAHDADLAAHDYSAEVSQSGTPDGSVWLGLTRDSFLNSACVRQGDLLGVREGSGNLRDALQKAVDKAERDVTAAKALAQLEKYRKFQIGSLRAPTKPLRIALDAVAAAERRLNETKDAHADYVRRQKYLKALEEKAGRYRQQVQAVQAMRADEAASVSERRYQRARELNRLFANGAPRALTDDADLANRVASAVAVWSDAPNPSQPQGETCAELASQLVAVQDSRRTLASIRPRQRPLLLPLGSGLGLVAAAGVLFFLEPPMELLLLGSVGGVAGLLVVWWASATGKRIAIERHAAQMAVLDERIDGLQDKISGRRVADSAYDEAMVRQKRARRALGDAAVAAGVEASDTNGQLRSLHDWQQERERKLERAARETKKWGELQGVLAGQSLAEVEREANAKRLEADGLLRRCDKAQLAEAHSLVDDLPQLQEAQREAHADVLKERGSLEQLARGLASIADAEDDYEDAKQRLRCIEDQDQTLAKTVNFLEKAQECVHRDVAVVLRATLLEWLPKVTEGRYGDCRVDPETLSVDVRDSRGDWRDANLLSHGTTEQVYLLLRMALCRHLVVDGETCPLILDDPFSACDDDRQRLILDTLLAISDSVQVIVFTHDAGARDWAFRHLSPRNNSQVVELQRADRDRSPSECLGTRIANRFRGGQLSVAFEELRGASVRPLDVQ